MIPQCISSIQYKLPCTDKIYFRVRPSVALRSGYTLRWKHFFDSSIFLSGRETDVQFQYRATVRVLMAARSVLDRVLEALSQQTLFTKINLLACQPVSTLSKFNSSAPITQLKRLFGEAFLEPRIGFNQVHFSSMC